jgi:hypothetical protein
MIFPIRAILALILIANLATEKVRRRPAFAWTVPALVGIYFIGGLYLTVVLVTRTKSGSEQMDNYAEYRMQRLAPGVPALAPNSVIAGDDEFCKLASIGENQRQLAGAFLNISMAVDNAAWRSRFVLNLFLDGTRERPEVEKMLKGELENGLWNVPKVTPELMAPWMHTYDEIVRDPNGFISAYAVRYVALRSSHPAPTYPLNGWTLLQRGPYWQLWERK